MTTQELLRPVRHRYAWIPDRGERVVFCASSDRRANEIAIKLAGGRPGYLVRLDDEETGR